MSSDFSHRLMGCPLCGKNELITYVVQLRAEVFVTAECKPCCLSLCRISVIGNRSVSGARSAPIDEVVSLWNSRAGQEQKPPGKQDKYIGQRFGRRVVVAGERKKTANKQSLVPWRCDCGKTGHSTVFDLRHHETCQNCFNDKSDFLPLAG